MSSPTTATKSLDQAPTANEILFASAASGSVDDVRAAIAKGASLTDTDERGLTALMLAAQNRTGVEIAKFLIEQGAHVGSHGSAEKAPLHVFSMEGRADLVTLALDHGAPVEGLDTVLREDSPPTPLMIAAARDNVAVMHVLLDAGANPNRKHWSGNLPIHAAQSAEVVALLCAHGAKLDVGDAFVSPPLFIAASRTDNPRSVEVCKAMLQHGASVNFRNFDGHTALHVSRGEATRVLIEAGADLNPADVYDLTPLAFAVSFDDADKARLLIEHGADLWPAGVISPLQAAATERACESFAVLVQAGANPASIDEKLLEILIQKKPELREVMDDAARVRELSAAQSARDMLTSAGQVPKPR
jgi:ankyrin repeat protein